MQAPNGDWRPPYPQPQTQASTSQPSHPAGGARPHYAGQQSMGFTQNQLAVLRNQIMAFRHIKGNEAVPPEVLAGVKPPPLLGGQPIRAQQHIPTLQQQVASQQPRLAHPQQYAPRPHLQNYQHPSMGATQPRPYQQHPVPMQHVRPPVSMPSAAAAPRQEAPKVPPPPSVASLLQPPQQVPVGQLKGALYSLASGSRAPPPMTIGEGLLSQRPQQPAINFSAAEVMRRECDRLVNGAMQRRAAELERMLAAEQMCPGFAQVDGKLPKGALMLELRRLRLRTAQEQLRVLVEKEQADIMTMQERAYRKFARNCQATRPSFDKLERCKLDAVLERVRAVKAWRTQQSERFSAQREARNQRNRNVTRTHERLSRQHSKLKDDDRTRRMDALRANDLEAYQELLREQGVNETQGERYEVITKFLNDTEEYLHKLAAKVSNVKVQQEASEAFAKATAEARAMGFTEEEVLAAATQAAKEAAASSELATQSQPDAGDAQSRYYSLAHSVEEGVKVQPAMLQGPGNAKLREYQLVGLQWMVSLYNNRLNGILADEMGLGKTVQVMALLAYLMENKGVFGPHLIIVPNAVIVNWKSELSQWLPDVRCVYYVGSKDERARMYSSEVQSLQFNVLVTTYEYIMRDRAKLSKVEWKYIIIDEAQRMKDRQSKLAKDLDRFTTSRRLLLTGTPLQNELRELWSLLNLLLPEVFDDKGTFTEWFGDSLGKAAEGGQGDEWLETEKRVVVIHRLHQILEPFMLRRQVEDVESKLPPKVSHVVKVAMPPYQGVIYNWIKATGTKRIDPATVPVGKAHQPYANLNNKCMELRKVCNHPALSYPPLYVMEGGDLLIQCGKFAVLDRMLVKLHASGHRVLLFSTMTKLLDLLEQYLRWRTIGHEAKRMGYLRIDGATSLEDREKAIRRFNDPAGDAFIFLLSIRAAGRGLNLQTADTVVIYDPDPNPKNEEQAIARSHRIGQTKEVRVFHLEAVADAPAEPTQEEGQKAGPAARKYADSIESLVRNSIQKTKIDMANEVIDAGRFDMSTTQEERKETLEALLQDEERMKKAVNKVPTAAELNRMLARTPQEVDLFDKMDARSDWPAIRTDTGSVPQWLQYTSEDMEKAVSQNSKARGNANQQAVAAAHGLPIARRRNAALPGQYAELDADDPEMFGTMSSMVSQDQTGMEASYSRSVMIDADDADEIVGGKVLPESIAAEPARGAAGETLPGTASRVQPNTPSVKLEPNGAPAPKEEPGKPGESVEGLQPVAGEQLAAVASGSGSGREHKKKKKRKEREREQQGSGAATAPLAAPSGSVVDMSSAPVKEEATSRPAGEEQPQKKLKLTIKLGPKPDAG